MKDKDTLVKFKIMNAVFEIVWQEGLEKVNMLGISKKVGVSVGTLYNYFPSKEKLIAEAYQTIEGKLITIAFEGVDDEMPYKTKVKKIYMNTVHYMVKDYQEDYFAEVCRRRLFTTKDNKSSVAALKDYYNVFLTVFQEGVDKRLLQSVDTVLITVFFLNSIRGISFAIRRNITPYSRKKLEQYFHFFWKGVSV